VNDISTLIAALTELTKKLGEATGIPRDIVSAFEDEKRQESGETGFNKDNTKVLPSRSNLTDKSKAEAVFLGNIIGKTIYDLTKKDEKPDFGFKQVKEEKIVPTLAKTPVFKEKTKSTEDGEDGEDDDGGVIDKVKDIISNPAVLTVLGILGTVGAIKAGANPVGNAINIANKIIFNVLQKAYTSIGNKIITGAAALADDLPKVVSESLGSKIGNITTGALDAVSDKMGAIGPTIVENVQKVAGGLLDNITSRFTSLISSAKILQPGGKIASLLSGLGKAAGSVLLKVARFLPFIGSAISFYFAYQKFQAGDTIGGAMELVSGIVNLIPGFGWIASIVIDLFTIGRDIKMTEEERVSQSGGFTAALVKAREFLSNALNKYLKYIPGIGGIVQAGLGIAQVFGGDIKGGLLEVLKGILNIVPGLGDTLFLGFEFLMDLISGDNSTDEVTGRKLSFNERVFNFINEKMDKLPWYIRKPLEWLGILKKEESDGSEVIPGNIDNNAVVQEEVKKINDKLADTLGNTATGIVDGIDTEIDTSNSQVAAAVRKAGKGAEDMASAVTGLNSQVANAANKAGEGVDMLPAMAGLNSQIANAANKAGEGVDMLSATAGLNTQVANAANRASEQLDMTPAVAGLNTQVANAANKAVERVDMLPAVKALNSNVTLAANKANKQIQSSTDNAIVNLDRLQNIDPSAVSVNVEPPKIAPPTVDVAVNSDQGEVIKSSNRIVEESVANRRIAERQTAILERIANNGTNQNNNIINNISQSQNSQPGPVNRPGTSNTSRALDLGENLFFPNRSTS